MTNIIKVLIRCVLIKFKNPIKKDTIGWNSNLYKPISFKWTSAAYTRPCCYGVKTDTVGKRGKNPEYPEIMAFCLSLLCFDNMVKYFVK